MKPGEVHPELARLGATCRDMFRAWTGRDAQVWAAAPGRVNLIGEHTDYSDGYVLPMAIDRWCVTAAARTDSGGWVMSDDIGRGETAAFDLASRDAGMLPGWARYPVGSIWKTLDSVQAAAGVGEPRGSSGRERGLAGVQMAILSSVPLGAGLSSSAAVELAAAASTSELLDAGLSRERLAEIARGAEHDFAGVPCGVMDQTVCACAEEGSAMLLDCRTLERRTVHLPAPGAAVLVIAHSGVKHALGSGEYANRRASVERAAHSLGVPALRDADLGLLRARGGRLSDSDRACARHVIAENARVLGFAEALKAGDLARSGALMAESHASLRDDFKVSCAELDAMVESAMSVPGVYGSRMTGGGFGGCTVTLCKPSSFEPLTAALGKLALGPHRVAPFVAKPVGGVRSWRL